MWRLQRLKTIGRDKKMKQVQEQGHSLAFECHSEAIENAMRVQELGVIQEAVSHLIEDMAYMREMKEESKGNIPRQAFEEAYRKLLLIGMALTPHTEELQAIANKLEEDTGKLLDDKRKL